jgi:DNA-directed RNA polymerase specialized sigma24 family protein
MSFPQTRLTLIQRLAAEGNEDDWRTFVRDYWGPVCRFALRWGAANADDAEDVALETFEVLWRNRLLVRWVSNRSAKLRTLLCGVVRNNLANRGRVKAGRERILGEASQIDAQQLDQWQRQTDEKGDVFYSAWAEDVVERAVRSLAAEYGRQGKGDYLRVLYGRICEEMTIAACAEALHLKPATIDNYYRHARDRLSGKLRELVVQQVARYASAEDFDGEMELEWVRLGQYLSENGGLEHAVRRAHSEIDPALTSARREAAIARLTTDNTDGHG